MIPKYVYLTFQFNRTGNAERRLNNCLDVRQILAEFAVDWLKPFALADG